MKSNKQYSNTNHFSHYTNSEISGGYSAKQPPRKAKSQERFNQNASGGMTNTGDKFSPSHMMASNAKQSTTTSTKNRPHSSNPKGYQQ